MIGLENAFIIPYEIYTEQIVYDYEYDFKEKLPKYIPSFINKSKI